MKFLIDQQLPRRLARWLLSKGHEAVHVLDARLERASDLDIWRHAESHGFVILTKDDDFSAVASTGVKAQVVWLRFGNCSNDDLIARVEKAWPSLIAELEAGARLVELR